MEVDTEEIITKGSKSATAEENGAIKLMMDRRGAESNLKEALDGQRPNVTTSSSNRRNIELQDTGSNDLKNLPFTYPRATAAQKISLVDKSNLPKRTTVDDSDDLTPQPPHRSRTLPTSERVPSQLLPSQFQSVPSGIPNVGQPRASLLSAPSSPRALRVFRDPSTSIEPASAPNKKTRRSKSARSHRERENSPAMDLRGLRAALPTPSIGTRRRAVSAIPPGNSLGLHLTDTNVSLLLGTNPLPVHLPTSMILSPRITPISPLPRMQHEAREVDDGPELSNLDGSNNPEPREGSVIPTIEDEINSSMILETFEFDEGDADETIKIDEATQELMHDREEGSLNGTLVPHDLISVDEEVTESPYFSQKKLPTNRLVDSAKVNSPSLPPSAMFQGIPGDASSRSISPDVVLHSPVSSSVSSTESMEKFSFSLPPRVPSPPIDPVDPSGQIPPHEDELAYYIRTTSSFQNQPPLFGLDSRNSTIDSLNDDEVGMGHLPGSQVGGTDRQLERVRRRRLMDQILSEAVQVGGDVSEDEMMIY